MKILWATDLHLEFASNPSLLHFANAVDAAEFDVAILTGDISIAPRAPAYFAVMAKIIGSRKAYFVLGNA